MDKCIYKCVYILLYTYIRADSPAEKRCEKRIDLVCEKNVSDFQNNFDLVCERCVTFSAQQFFNQIPFCFFNAENFTQTSRKFHA